MSTAYSGQARQVSIVRCTGHASVQMERRWFGAWKWEARVLRWAGYLLVRRGSNDSDMLGQVGGMLTRTVVAQVRARGGCSEYDRGRPFSGSAKGGS